ncbi:MAG: ATP-binding protein [Actinocrinis sp.]
MTYHRRFPSDPPAVAGARRFAGEVLRDQPPRVVDCVLLMLSELATNAIKHAGAEFDVSLDVSPGHIRVEVGDAGSGLPVLRSPSPSDRSGRGLRIVEMLAKAWGFVSDDRGRKSIWFTLDLPPVAEGSDDGHEASSTANSQSTSKLPEVLSTASTAAGRTATSDAWGATTAGCRSDGTSVRLAAAPRRLLLQGS